MRHIALPGAVEVPALGLGTWKLGESARSRAAEVAAVQRAIELGYRVIDTAEMYGEGGAEEIVGEALRRAIAAGTVRRDEVLIVSKVYPHNASRSGVAAACRRSLARLGLERIDLYLLHWPGAHPLRETVAGFEDLAGLGLIGRWGVSNFDVDDLEALWRVENGHRCAANQIYYSLTERGPEFALLPWHRAHGIATMAYSPIDQGRLAGHRALARVAAAAGRSPAQIALAWVVSQDGVMAIPKAGREAHLRENLEAAGLTLDPATQASLDVAFPPPTRKSALAMI